MHLSGILTELLKQNLPFACYRLPATGEPVLLLGGDFQLLNSPADAIGNKGFIVVPFETDKAEPVLFFASINEYRGWEHDLDLTLSEKTPVSTQRPIVPISIDYKTYQKQAAHLIRFLGQGQLKKVVLSRVICQPLEPNFCGGMVFTSICLQYPDAFTYIFNDGRGRCWMGASPEMLLRVNGEQGHTVSLAATQSALNQEQVPLSWPEKEKQEQELVSLYIRDILQQQGITNIIESPLQTIQAGPVEHLQKSFQFRVPLGTHPLQLALALHPTPAVCGLPVEQALELILNTESHQRSYYAGFLGPVSNKGQTDLFVNIRCMQLIDNIACLFVGGGLLAASQISEEWQETIKKAETLLGMLQK